MNNFENAIVPESVVPVQENGLLKRVGIVFAGGAVALASIGALSAEAVDTPVNCEIDGCATEEVPVPTIAEDAEPVPGNQDSGEEADLDPELDDKGGDLTTSTVAPTTTIVAPTTTSTITIVTAPPTLPPMTVVVPTVAEPTN